MSDLSASTMAVSQEPTPFRYEQNHGDFFVLYLKTVLLSIVTLGIYSFWGRVAINKFIYNHTSFGKHSFDYHATGKELFIGFLKGMAIVAVVGLLVFALIKFVPIIQVPLTIILYLIAIFFLTPYVLIGKWRFWLSRSSYCNVRFKHTGEYRQLRGMWIKGVLLSIVTLGFYGPVLQNRVQKFYTDHNRFGTLEFKYSGKDGEFFGMVIVGVILTILTLGIYSFWYAAKLNRYILSHTTLNGRSFNSTITGGGLFLLSITNTLLLMITLSLGFPIAVNRMYHYFFSTITLDVDPEQIATVAGTMDTGASAFAGGLEEAANVVDAVAGVF